MTLLYAPLTAVALVLTWISLSAFLDGNGGAIVPFTIVLLIAIAVMYQAQSAIRDLRSEPIFTRGEVSRTWTKGGVLWFFRSHYVMIKREVFVMEPEIWVQISEGDLVEFHHWPKTKTLIRVILLQGEYIDLKPDEPLVPILED